MTELEVVELLQELKGAGLANEPKDPEATVKIWLDFFGGDDFRVIGKAVGLHLKKSHFWPTPGDIEDLKKRAQWLNEMGEEKDEMMRQLSILLTKLHRLKLEGEPGDLLTEVIEWYKWFNSNTIEQVKTALARYLELSQVWPEPSQISYFLPTVEEQKKLNALGGDPHTDISLIKQKTKQPPRAPAIKIEPRKCELHTGECTLLDDLCDGPVDGKCPYEGL